jgi:SAM-dependent methyltransferase
LRLLEESYLKSADPIVQSGFGGGPERWRDEREVILQAVDGDGDFLDVGCANGYLLECLCHWARARGIFLTPYGVDYGPRLVKLARRRFSEHADGFWVANAWEWQPPRRFHYVYSLCDCVPRALLEEYVSRLASRCVEPGGTLIIGAYGSRSRREPAFDVGRFLRAVGHQAAGSASVGQPPVSCIAWVKL